MPNIKNNIALVIGATALFTGCASAHGILTGPMAKILLAGDSTKYSYMIQAGDLPWDGPFNHDPITNTKSFWTGMNSSDYKDIRDLVNKVAKVDTPGATIECGNTDPDAPPQPLPDMIEWSHSASEGFTQSHGGPCGVWCDDTMVFHDDNCALHYPEAPARMPYDKAACEGANRLTFYWLALHTPAWQVYISCVPLEGGQGGTTPNVTTPTTTPSAYAPATPSPPAPPAPPADTPESPADAPTTAPPPTSPADDQAPSAYAPEPPTDAPTTSTTPPTDAPASSATPNAKCVRRRRTRD